VQLISVQKPCTCAARSQAPQEKKKTNSFRSPFNQFFLTKEIIHTLYLKHILSDHVMCGEGYDVPCASDHNTGTSAAAALEAPMITGANTA
jgi:hypothetical protein